MLLLISFANGVCRCQQPVKSSWTIFFEFIIVGIKNSDPHKRTRHVARGNDMIRLLTELFKSPTKKNNSIFHLGTIIIIYVRRENTDEKKKSVCSVGFSDLNFKFMFEMNSWIMTEKSLIRLNNEVRNTLGSSLFTHIIYVFYLKWQEKSIIAVDNVHVTVCVVRVFLIIH